MKYFIFFALSILLSYTAKSQGSLSSGLELYLPFNGNTLDVSGNGHHATNSGASLTIGAGGFSNTAYFFNGAAFMKVNHHTDLNPKKFSICAKVKVTGFYNGYCYNNIIITKGLQRTSGFYSLQHTQTQLWSCSFEDTNKHNYRIDVQNISTPLSTMETTPYLVKNNWDCLVATFDGDTAKMYVNGVFRFKYYEPSFSSNTADIFIGMLNSTTYPFYFKGAIDEIRIYNRALSASEVNTYCGYSSPTNTINANFKDSSISCFTKQFTDLSTVSSTALKLWFWDFGDGGTSNLKNPTHSYAVSGTYNVKLIVVDSNGYADTIIKAITTSKYRFLKVSNDTTICEIPGGVNIPLNAVGGMSYSWSPSLGLSNPFIANPIATITTSTTYIVTATDSFGCIDNDTINIIVDNNFANAGTDITLCLKDGVDVIKLNGSGGVSYTWSPSTGLSNPLIPDPIATIYAPTFYRLTVINSIGCIDDDTVHIFIDTSKVKASPKNIFGCIGQKVQFNATGTISYEWLPTNGLNNAGIFNPILTIDSIVKYKVAGISIYGCTTTDSVSISLKKSIVSVFPKFIGSCGEEAFELLATGAETYNWYPDRGLDQYDIKNPTLLVTESVRYVVVGKDSNGCTDSAYLDVVKHPSPVVEIYNNGQVVSCENKTTLLSAKGATKYDWSPEYYCDNSGSSSTTVRPIMTTVFKVKGIDTNGCVGEDTATVFYEGKTSVAVPNAFTPNGDGINDRIKPIIICDFQFKEFSIFNRWGNRIYSTEDLNNAWDGSSKGIPCSMDTYFYMIIGKNSLGKEILLKGDIVLIR